MMMPLLQQMIWIREPFVVWKPQNLDEEVDEPDGKVMEGRSPPSWKGTARTLPRGCCAAPIGVPRDDGDDDAPLDAADELQSSHGAWSSVPGDGVSYARIQDESSWHGPVRFGDVRIPSLPQGGEGHGCWEEDSAPPEDTQKGE